MHEFFRGWRRKLGVVTLMMACVFMAGWVRSWTITDEFEFPVKKGVSHLLISGDNWIGWVVQHDGNPIIRRKKPVKLPTPKKIKRMSWQSRDAIEGYRQFIRIHMNLDGSTSIIDNPNFFLPYWSIVSPLTLLSAYLLLSNPRKPNSGPTHV